MHYFSYYAFNSHYFYNLVGSESKRSWDLRYQITEPGRNWPVPERRVKIKYIIGISIGLDDP